MTSVVAAGRRYLPRGYADLARQLVIWFGFLFAYQIARGLADRNPSKAFENGFRVVDVAAVSLRRRGRRGRLRQPGLRAVLLVVRPHPDHG